MKTKIYILIFLSLSIFISCSTPKKQQIPKPLKGGDQRLLRGNSLIKEGKNDDAAFNFIKAYKLYSSIDDILGCGASLTGLSISLFRQNRYDESIMFLEKAQTYYLNLNDLKQLSSFYITKASLLTELEKLDEAKLFLNKAKNLNSTDKRLYLSFAALEIKRKNMIKAKEYIDISTTQNSAPSSFLFYIKGLYAYETKDFKDSEAYLLKALKIDKKNANTPMIASDLYALYKLYKTKDDLKKAKSYLLRALKIYALMENIDKTNRLITELKNIKKGSDHDISVENFFIKKWMN